MYIFFSKAVVNNLGATLVLFASFYSLSFAQPPDTLWTKRYGTEDNDIGYDMQPTSDGGYIIVGQTGNFGAPSGPYLYLVKIDGEDGDSLWARVYGNDEQVAVGYSAQETSDGGFIVAGFKEFSTTGNRDIYLLRTDSFGDTIWTMTYGGPYAETYEEVCRSVIETFDKGYLMGGYTHFYSGSHLYLIRTDSLGDTVWTKSYGEHNRFASARSIRQTQDGGYIIAGTIGPIEYGYKGWLLKTDAYGDTLWARMYGDEEWNTHFHEMQVTSDSGYIISGETHYAYYDRRTYLVKTDKDGAVLWSRKYPASFDPLADILGQSVQETPDGGFIVVGTRLYPYNNFDIYVIRTDSWGSVSWTQNYGNFDDQEIGYSIQVTAEGNYVIAGSRDSLQTYDFDVFVMKTTPDVGIEEDDTVIRKYNAGTTIFSGPLQLPEGKKCRVYDITGRIVKPSKIQPGIYFIEIEGVVTQKVIKVR
jgi:hypothetical protein